jgi:hypothetical protein
VCCKPGSFRVMFLLFLQCPHRVVPCELCSWLGSSAHLDEHVGVCPGVQVSCDICGVEMLRNQLESHVMNSLASHMPLLMQKESFESCFVGVFC